MLKIAPTAGLIAYLCAGAFIMFRGGALPDYSPFDWMAAVSQSASLLNLFFAASLFWFALYLYFSTGLFEMYLSGTTLRNTARWRLLTVLGMARRLLIANFWLFIVIQPKDYGVYLVALYGILLICHRIIHVTKDELAAGSDKLIWRLDAIQLLVLLCFLVVTSAASAPTTVGSGECQFIETARVIGFFENGIYIELLLASSIFYILILLILRKTLMASMLEYIGAALIVIGAAKLLMWYENALPALTSSIPSYRLGSALPYWQTSISTGNFGALVTALLIVYFILISLSLIRLFTKHDAIYVVYDKA